MLFVDKICGWEEIDWGKKEEDGFMDIFKS